METPVARWSPKDWPDPLRQGRGLAGGPSGGPRGCLPVSEAELPGAGGREAPVNEARSVLKMEPMT